MIIFGDFIVLPTNIDPNIDINTVYIVINVRCYSNIMRTCNKNLINRVNKRSLYDAISWMITLISIGLLVAPSP